MRPIPHNKVEGENTDDRVRLTSRRTSRDDSEDDEAWLAAQEF